MSEHTFADAVSTMVPGAMPHRWLEAGYLTLVAALTQEEQATRLRLSQSTVQRYWWDFVDSFDGRNVREVRRDVLIAYARAE